MSLIRDEMGIVMDRLCPMHVILGDDGRITRVGPTLQKLRPDVPMAGQMFLELFELNRPRAVNSMADLIERQGAKLHLRLRDVPRTALKGQIVKLPNTAGSVVNLSFGISVLDAVRDYELNAADFAATDLTIEMLYLVEAKSAAMEASRKLNMRLQGAMIAAMDPAETLEAMKSPFFVMAPDMLRLPLVILATAATFIASQAVISGAFSITHQAIQLGFIPRLSTEHTSATERGQIYIPFVNNVLMVSVILLVLMFQSSTNLASAYGIAVTGAMFIDTLLMGVLLLAVWRWKWFLAVPVLLLFIFVDGAYFAANLPKVPSGGWFPLVVGGFAFLLLTTWSRGRKLMRERMSEVALPIEIFAKSAQNSATRVPGTAVFMASSTAGVPSALLHNIKHNKVLHERVVILTVEIQDVPYVNPEERCNFTEIGDGFYRAVLHYGFMDETNVPEGLKHMSRCGGSFDMMDTSFFLSRQTLLPGDKPGMPVWREKIFSWMLRNAASAMEFFSLPTNRVVELGSQVRI